MTPSDPDEYIRRLVAESMAANDATGWFEQLYSAAERGAAVVPWDRGGPHPLLEQWAENGPIARGGALVIGTGPGSDAEFVAGLGWRTVAFDISATAISSARRRFPTSEVQYVVADLLDPPAEWHEAFDLVVESLTVQSMPIKPRPNAIANVAGFVAPGGTLVVIASARDEADAPEGPPWPLTRADIDSFADAGLDVVSVELLPNPLVPGAHRWLAEFRRSSVA